MTTPITGATPVLQTPPVAKTPDPTQEVPPNVWVVSSSKLNQMLEQCGNIVRIGNAIGYVVGPAVADKIIRTFFGQAIGGMTGEVVGSLVAPAVIAQYQQVIILATGTTITITLIGGYYAVKGGYHLVCYLRSPQDKDAVKADIDLDSFELLEGDLLEKDANALLADFESIEGDAPQSNVMDEKSVNSTTIDDDVDSFELMDVTGDSTEQPNAVKQGNEIGQNIAISNSKEIDGD